MKITYCSWEGDPAILVNYEDGRIYGFWKPDGSDWKRGQDADIATKAAVIGEAAFKKRWPDLALPTFPE
jgi:hypothetical protein